MSPHRPSHWILLFLVALAALFTLREVHGQTSTLPSTDARTQFEGMPSMAGAQAGIGAQAGPPQGGLGVQGDDERHAAFDAFVKDLRQARKLFR